MRRIAAQCVFLSTGFGLLSLHAQLPSSSIITTFAGAAWRFSGSGSPATGAPISPPNQLSTDPQGNIIFADYGNHVVSRLNTDGTLSVLAGNGIDGFSGDGGSARSASLNRPSAAVMDANGALYIYDSFNARIRKVSTSGTITTYAGTGIFGSTGNGGPALKANIENAAARLAIDSVGNLYLTNPDASTVRRITPDGTISLYAGGGGPGHSGDNIPATQAGLALGGGQIACDAAGNLYIAETGNSQIRMVSPKGIITTIAGTGVAGYKDGPALSAQFANPFGIGVDASGNIYVADENNDVVRKISGGVVTTIAGVKGSFGFSGDGGPPLKAVFGLPGGVAVDGKGAINIADGGNLRIRAISPTANTVSTVAGNGQFRMTPNGTPASRAYFFGPQQISFDPNGNLLIADSATFRIRRVNADGTFQTIAGDGVQGIGEIGIAATKSFLSFPRMAVADSQGTIYIADSGASIVYRIGPAGNLGVVAGLTGFRAGFSGDGGPANKALLNGPTSLGLDTSGNLYIADNLNNCVRKVTFAAGSDTISTFAGICGKSGFSGDGGPANQALMSAAFGIAFDPQGNLIVTDNQGNRIRKVTPDGSMISTIAGDGHGASTGNGGPAMAASVWGPQAVAIDSQGTIYFTEIGAHVREILPNGNMSAFAGSGRVALAGDGGAVDDASFQPVGLAVDAAGNVYISDFFNDRIRIALAIPPTVTASQSSLSFTAASGGAPTDPQAIALSSTLNGQLLMPGSDSPAWLKVSKQVASTPQNIQIYVDPGNLKPGSYQGNVTLQTPGVPGALLMIPVSVVVSVVAPPYLSVQAPVLSFSFLHAGAAQTESFAVANSGGGTLTFQASVSGAAAPGITLSLQSGSAAPNNPAAVVVTVDPTQLPDGSSSAQLLVSSSTGQSATIPLTVTIVPAQPRMTLPQRGFLFTAVQGGGVTPPQTFDVLNSGNTTFTYTASAAPLSGGSGWLTVTPATGSTSSSKPGTVRIAANPNNLSPGVYYALVPVSSKGTANSPQEVEVVLNLLTPDFDPGAVVTPSGLVFSAVSGASEDPGSQTFQITNLSASSVQFALQPVQLGGSWLRARPDTGTLAPGKSQTIVVQVAVNSLAAGVYNGSIAIQVGQVPRSVNVLLVVAPGVAPTSASSLSARDAAAACAPTTLYPVLTSLVQDFTIPANWPIPVEVAVVDDCGVPMTTGRVVTSFSNGDPPIALTSLNNGRWQGTWFGGNIRGSQIVITAKANMDSPQLSGNFAYTGTLRDNSGIPVVNSGGVTTAAVSASQAPLSPGSLISINGANLAAGTNPALRLPLATTLSGAQVLLAGRLLPLLYTSGGLINAIVPYDLDANAQYQLIVSSGGAISGPQTVTVASAQPAIFKIDNSGSMQVPQDVWNRITNGVAADSGYAAPASAIGSGDSLVIYCTGLGAVNQAVDPTVAAPGSVTTSNAVTVSIGGQSVTPSLAGLVPGYTGLYQVNVTVPSGVAAGSNVPVIVSVAGQSSAPISVTTH